MKKCQKCHKSFFSHQNLFERYAVHAFWGFCPTCKIVYDVAEQVADSSQTSQEWRELANVFTAGAILVTSVIILDRLFKL